MRDIDNRPLPKPNPVRMLAGLIAAFLVAVALAPSAAAEPGIGTGGADVFVGPNAGSTVTVNAEFIQAPSASGASSSAGPASGGPSGPALTTDTTNFGSVTSNADTGEKLAIIVNDPKGGAPASCDLVTLACVPLSPDLGVPATPVGLAEATAAASRAVAALQIEPIDIGIVPEPTSSVGGRTGLVGLNSWIWPAGAPPRQSQVGPINRVVPGPITITMNAVNTGLLVNYGDHSAPYPCPVQSVPYIDAALDLPSPTCNHVLQRTSMTEPGGVFRPSVTSLWVVTWTATAPNGATFGGTIPVTPTAQTEVRVGELQVLVTPGF